jgi:hypothetical protein
MNRRNFGKTLAAVATVAAVAPKMLADKPSKIEYTVDDWAWTPLVERDYSIGLYLGDGTENSPSCMSIMRTSGPDKPCVQVDEVVSTSWTGPEWAELVARAARKYRFICKDRRGPMIAIEQIRCPGDTVQNQLKLMGFTRFPVARRNHTPRKREGWYTNRLTAPLVVARFLEAIHRGWYEPNSSSLVKNLNTTERQELEYNSYFMAAAISYCAITTQENERNV